MDEILIIPADDESHFFKRVMGQYDVPAFARRARQVQDAHDQLLARCRKQRESWLEMVRLRLGVLYARAGQWEALRPCLPDAAQLRIIQNMHAELKPQLRAPVQPTTSTRSLRRALRELFQSIERFNARWTTYLRKIDLEPLHVLIDGYNRYYLLEKECAFRSIRAARQGYRPLEPMTREKLHALFPTLPVPRLGE